MIKQHLSQALLSLLASPCKLNPHTTPRSSSASRTQGKFQLSAIKSGPRPLQSTFMPPLVHNGRRLSV